MVLGKFNFILFTKDTPWSEDTEISKIKGWRKIFLANINKKKAYAATSTWGKNTLIQKPLD